MTKLSRRHDDRICAMCVLGARTRQWLLLCLAACSLPMTMIIAQPHPYPMGFTVFAWSSCPDLQTCTLAKFSACMELFYYPAICHSRVINTTVEGNCSQAGKYHNNTVMSLRAPNSALPFEGWVVNFNSSNPMLPHFSDGLETGGDRISVMANTTGHCKTNITVLAGMVINDIDCDEEMLLNRCTGRGAPDLVN